MARALLMVSTPRTLEDHARKVIQLLWLELLTEPQQTATALDYDLIADQLAWRIGCGDSKYDPGWEQMPCQPKQALDANALHPLLQEVPLFTPLLVEERFAVQQWLDQLRQQGWLQHADSHTAVPHNPPSTVAAPGRSSEKRRQTAIERPHASDRSSP